MTAGVRDAGDAGGARDAAAALIAQTERVSAPNYAPLPVVICRGEGVWVFDVAGRKYLDCISAYSSLNQGHRHPRIVRALLEQAERLTLTSRAVHNDRMGPFRDNFHGRTTTIVGFSSEPQYREDFGPYSAGFTLVDFGDLDQLRAAITPNTVAFLVEPIQAEAGIIVPPDGYLAGARELCRERNVLFVLDEIQTGLGRTGKLFAHEHEPGAEPDVMILGKALGGGVYPVSAVLASRAIMTLLKPGDHGSTFGGNPLAAAVGSAALDVLIDEDLTARAAELGAHLRGALAKLRSGKIADIRGRGLLIGIEITSAAGTARAICERLLERGVLAKDTHAQVIRLAPPLVVERAELDWLVAQLDAVLE